MKYAIHLQRKIGTNVYDVLYVHTYENVNDYLIASLEIVACFNKLGLCTGVQDIVKEDFTHTYITID